jgi:hypothetical protein
MLKRFMLAGAAALAASSAAHAAVTVTITPGDTNYAQDLVAVPNSKILWDFDTIFAPGYNYTPVTAEATGSVTNVTLTPLGDRTRYGSVNPTDSPAIFTTPHGLESFSMLVGSPDTFNRIRFIGLDGVTVIGDLKGSTGLFGTFNPVNGANVARRFTWSFGGAKVGSIQFYSNVNKSSYAFEFDRLSGVVPEPTTWALMLLGFFGLGAMLRQRRASSVPA